MQQFKRLFIAFLPAWLISYLIASVTHSLAVQNKLIAVDISIDWSTRVQGIAADIIGLAPSYGVIIGVSLLLGFLLINPLTRFLPLPMVAKYPIGGIIAFATMLFAVNAIFNIHLIAGARDAGLYMQCLSGAVGGWVFYFILSRTAG